MRYVLNQMGFVVDDIDKAMKEYGEIYHIKKWYITKFSPEDKQYYKGKLVEDKDLKIVLGYNGKMEFELIQTSCKENMYSTFLKEHGSGYHHICYHLKNLNKAVKEYKAMGFEVLQNGDLNSKSAVSNYAYVAKPGEENVRVIELSETVVGKKRSIRAKHHVVLSALLGGMKTIKTKDIK